MACTLWDLTFEELRALMDAGHGHERQISANTSHVDWAMASQTPAELRTWTSTSAGTTRTRSMRTSST